MYRADHRGDVFQRAKKIIEERRVQLSEEEMLARLRRTLIKEGRLSPAIIDRTVGLPCTATYQHHFGLRNAYRLVGYTPKRDFSYGDSRGVWTALIAQLMSQLVRHIERAGGRVKINSAAQILFVNEKVGITFRPAQCWRAKKESFLPTWGIQRAKNLPAGWVVAIRLTDFNTRVLDYLLMPAPQVTVALQKFTEKHRVFRKARHFDTFDALVRSLLRRLTAKDGVSRANTSRLQGRMNIRRLQKHGRLVQH